MTPKEYKEMKEIIEESIKFQNDAKEYKDTLILIMRTLDQKFNKEVQSDNNPIGWIRYKIDRMGLYPR